MVTYTVKDAEGENKVLYTTSNYNVLYVNDMTDDQIVTNIRFNFELPVNKTAVESVELPTTYTQFPSSGISWAIKNRSR